MRKKTIISLIVVAVLILGAVSVFALDYYRPEDAVNLTARFYLTEPDVPGNEFSMVSEDGEHVINITEETLVYFEGFVPLCDDCDGLTQMVREVLFGRPLSEVLNGRNLRVIFEESEQIEPISVMVLFETFVTLPEVIDEGAFSDSTGEIGLEIFEPLPGEIGFEAFRPIPGEIGLEVLEPQPGVIDLLGLGPVTLNGEIVVNNKILEGSPLPFWYEMENGGVVMAPLRVVAEALGFDVTWNEYLQSIQLGQGIHIWIGSTEAHIGRMAPIELSAAPILLDGSTFVPLDFFYNVLGQIVYVFEGQIVFDEYDDMT